MALNNQCSVLAELGRWEEALAAVTEAVTIRRELAAAHPDAFAPDLAMALTNQSGALANLGRHKEALAAVTEAVTIRRELAAQHAVFVPDVAGSLTVQGLVRARLGDFEGAVSASREAVSIYTALVPADPNRYRDGYEQAIESIELLAACLKELGRTEREIAEELEQAVRALQ